MDGGSIAIVSSHPDQPHISGKSTLRRLPAQRTRHPSRWIELDSLWGLRLEYGGQPIEIAVGDDAKYRDSRLGEWHDAAVDYAASERLDVLGVNVPAIRRHQLLSYKRRLDRAVDRVDVEEITGG